MSKLPFSTGGFAAGALSFMDERFGQPSEIYLVNANNFASLGIRFGMLAVGLLLRDGDMPSIGSLCLVWIEGDRLLLRLIEMDGQRVILDDGYTCQGFCLDDVRFESSVLYATDSNAVVGWFRTDTSGAVTDVSEEFLRAVGGTLEEWAGDAWVFKVHPVDRQRLFGEWRRALHEGVALIVSASYLIAGECVPFTVSIEPRRNLTGAIVEWAGFITLLAVESRKRA